MTLPTLLLVLLFATMSCSEQREITSVPATLVATGKCTVAVGNALTEVWDSLIVVRGPAAEELDKILGVRTDEVVQDQYIGVFVFQERRLLHKLKYHLTNRRISWCSQLSTLPVVLYPGDSALLRIQYDTMTDRFVFPVYSEILERSHLRERKRVVNGTSLQP